MSDIVERLEACLDIPEVPSSVCRAISEAVDLITSLRALVATPKPEAKPVAFTKQHHLDRINGNTQSGIVWGKRTEDSDVPLYAHPPKPEATEGGAHGPKYRHKKRGTVYEQIALASLQCAEACSETAVLVISRGDDGKVWARPHDEFHDGRFEVATPSPVLGNEKEGGK